jgi:molybdopterin/thiamine biosynthesis adenylyltransferase
VDDASLLRYSRHILLDDIGVEGQQRIQAGRVLIIGAGGLGCPAALYLAGAGVGRITVIDPDVVDLTNLQRQIAHATARIGEAKVDSLRSAMAALNPEIDIETLAERADETVLEAQVARADVVLDCTDNFHTRHAVNVACVRHGRPLVSGAAIRFDAQVTVFDPRSLQSPCYACVFPADDEFEEARCATLGVFAPLVGIVGATQAAEALKLLAGAGESLAGRLLMLDARRMEWTTLRARRQPACPVCAPLRAAST